MPKLDECDSAETRLGLNLFDVSRLEGEPLFPVVAKQLVLEKSGVRLDPDRPDEVCIVLGGDLLSAATLCDIVRSDDRRAGRTTTRVYLRREDGSWRRLAADEVLTRVVGRQVVLSPAIFPQESTGVEAITAPAVRALAAPSGGSTDAG